MSETPADWVWHEKRYRGSRIPKPIYGQGHSEVEPDEDPNFGLDEKTGLFLPDSAAKQRRRVQIGFVPPSEPKA